MAKNPTPGSDHRPPWRRARAGSLRAVERLKRLLSELGAPGRTAMWLRDQPGRYDPAAATDVGARATTDLRVKRATRFGTVEPLAPAVGRIDS